MENKIAIFKDAETILEVPVSTEEKTVWLNRQQMSVLFDRDVKTIGSRKICDHHPARRYGR